MTNNLLNVDNTTYAYSVKYDLHNNPWFANFFQDRICEENHYKAITPVQLEKNIPDGNQDAVFSL